jgi:hypothetical protein
MIKQWNPKIPVVGLWINANWVVEKVT